MKRSHIVALTLALVALPLMVFVGCSNNPLAPDTTQSDQAGDFFSQPWPEDGLGRSVQTLRTFEAVETQLDPDVIDPQTGGTVPVDLNDGSSGEFKVEPGSMSEPAEITIEPTVLVFRDGTKSVLFECGPDGLVFDPAATLTVDTDALGAGVTSVTLFWLNEATGRWEEQGRFAVKRDGTVDLLIGHFSRYGISR